MRNIRWLALCLLPALACQPARAPDSVSTESSVAPLMEARFGAELERARTDFGVPGATAAYALPDGTVGVAACGLADLEDKTPMTSQSRMLAASVGKTFVAATALALASEDRLALDARIETWLSGYPWFTRLPNHDSMTLRHLLTHTSGLPDHVHMPEFAAAMANRGSEQQSVLSPEALVEYVLDKAALSPAGQSWSYSDTGYIVAGLVLEQASGRPYYQEVSERFLLPLGLEATSPSDRPALRDLAAGYTSEQNPFGLPVKSTVSPGVMAWNPAVEWTGGGLVSSPRDLVVWARALYEGSAIKGAYLSDLLRSVPVEGDASGVRYGAGVAIQKETEHGPSYGHAGSIPGYLTSLRYYPLRRVAIAFQINSDTEAAANAVRALEGRLASVVAGSAR